MPITQQRLNTLLREYEAVLRAVDALLANVETVYASKAMTTADKLELVYAESLLLRDLHRTHAMLERRDLDRNWKRNQRTAAKMERKRRAQGIAPRAAPTESDWIPHNARPEPFTFDEADEAAYAAFNAQAETPAPDDEAAEG